MPFKRPLTISTSCIPLPSSVKSPTQASSFLVIPSSSTSLVILGNGGKKVEELGTSEAFPSFPTLTPTELGVLEPISVMTLSIMDKKVSR